MFINWSKRKSLAVIGAIAIIALLSGCLATTSTGTVKDQAKAIVSQSASPEIQQDGLMLVAEFEAWMAKHKVWSGSIAVSHQGAPVIHKGIRRDASKAYPVASLSKAVTAVCAQQVLDKQGKQVSLTLAEAIPGLMKQYPPVDSRLGSITVAQLISHNSGIHSRYHRNFISNSGVFNQSHLKKQFQAFVRQQHAAAPGSGYHYSNANYMLLGLVIESLSGGEYEQTCRELTLTPVGIDARLNPQWRVMSSWGGWAISSLDYLKFLNGYFSDNLVLGRQPDSLGVNTPLRRGSFYNLGVTTRTANGGHRFWHAGSWRWKGGGRNDQFGAYFLTREDGLMVSVNYSTHAQGEKLRDLENGLVKAMRL